jgi:hypothetical protein
MKHHHCGKQQQPPPNQAPESLKAKKPSSHGPQRWLGLAQVRAVTEEARTRVTVVAPIIGLATPGPAPADVIPCPARWPANRDTVCRDAFELTAAVGMQ